jgi:hypothetical protein
MEWKNIEVNAPLEDCANSLLFESGDDIATLKSDNGVCVCIDVTGETKIFYNGDVYRYARNFPAELTEAIKDGSIEQMQDVEILDNNWFEVTVMKNGNVIDSEIWETPLDTLSVDELQLLLQQYVENSYPELCEDKSGKEASKASHEAR